MKRTLFLGLLLAALTGTTASGVDNYATPTITWKVDSNTTWTDYAAPEGAHTQSSIHVDGNTCAYLSDSVVKDGQGTLTINSMEAQELAFELVNYGSGDVRRLIVREGGLVLDGSMHLYANAYDNAVNVGGNNASLTLKNGAQLSTVYGSGNASSRIGSADGNGTLTVDGQGSIYQVSHCLWVGGDAKSYPSHSVASYADTESQTPYSQGTYVDETVGISKGVINLTNGGKLLISDSMGGGTTGKITIGCSDITISGEGSQLSNLGSKSPGLGWADALIGLSNAYSGVANDIKLSDGGRMDVKTRIWQGFNAMSTESGCQENNVSLTGGTATTTLRAWGVNDTYQIAAEGSNGTITPIDPTTVTIPADERYDIEDFAYGMGYAKDYGNACNYSGKNTLTIKSDKGKSADFIVGASLCTGWASNGVYGDGTSIYDVVNEISASGAGSHIQVDGDLCNGYVTGGKAWGSYKCESSFTLSDGATANIDGGVYSALVFANTGATAPTIKHDISVQSGASLRIGDVLECMGGNIYTNEAIGLTVNLTVTGNGSKLYVGRDAYFGNGNNAKATVIVADGASAEFAGDVRLSGTATYTSTNGEMNAGTLYASGSTINLTQANITSTAQGTVQGSTIKGTGTLTNLAISNNSKLIAGNSPGVMTLENNTVSGSSMQFYVGEQAKLTLQSGARALSLSGNLTTSGFRLTSTTVLSDTISLDLWTDDNFDYTGLFTRNGQSLQLFIIEDGANLTNANLTLGDSFTTALANNITLSWDTSTLATDGIIRVVETNPRTFSDVALGYNPRAGAQLLWENINPAMPDLRSTDLLALRNHLADIYMTEGMGGETNRLLAAAAGSANVAMGAAYADDMDRQLRAIRNRTVAMGGEDTPATDSNGIQIGNKITYNAWVNAEGNYRRINASDWDTGYRLDSWGGTVGFDANVTPRTTVGLALTAMYGDLTADTAEDSAKGDLDTYYLTLFAHHTQKRWTHTFVAAVGHAEADMHRTVRFGAHEYSTKGDTSGLSWGALYEVGYSIALNKAATAHIQPIANIAFRSSQLDAYTETGSDAALHVGKQEMQTMTFGLGARMTAEAGNQIINRKAIVEARALVKADVGDKRSETVTELVNGTGATGNIRSVERKPVGAELGAGISIPVNHNTGAVFMDMSAELRASSTTVKGCFGYKKFFYSLLIWGQVRRATPGGNFSSPCWCLPRASRA